MLESSLIYLLTHWGRVTHICVGNLTIIGSDYGLLPGRLQAITWTNVGILLIGLLGTNFKEMLIEIHTFSFNKIHLKMSSGKWRPFCLGLNVLRLYPLLTHYGLVKPCNDIDLDQQWLMMILRMIKEPCISILTSGKAYLLTFQDLVSIDRLLSAIYTGHLMTTIIMRIFWNLWQNFHL